MTEFRTIVGIPDFPWKNGYGKSSVFMGSCFTENIGGRMQDQKYNVDLNPFGILYNPASVANSIRILLEEKMFSSGNLVMNDGLWHSFNHHSRFSSANIEETLGNINNRIKLSAAFIKTADFLFITFGTAWVYELKDSGEIVSNCHKIPAKKFRRYRLSVDEIVQEYCHLLEKIWEINSNIKVIFTVSPIRHWKDGAVENQLSKATLLLAANRIIEVFGAGACGYFPSFEIVMDELRDYRFYAEDMFHLSKTATDYIWERFETALIDKKSQEMGVEIAKIRKAFGHRPFNPHTKEHLKFLDISMKRARELSSRHPYINLKLEIDYFNEQIEKISRNTNLSD
ncbi:MAG: GSCFA domain-containing protein [Chlorobi bacterium]|nr:GSCFA domain-containing protein [Chlorobiota bacterium]